MTVAEYNHSVEEFADNIYRFILKSLSDPDKASDIVQDTYEKLWIKHDDVNFEKVKSYLFTTAYHTMIDMIRKEKRVTGMDAVKMEQLTCDSHYNDVMEVLNKAVKKLPEIQRTVLLLRDYEGYSYDEISGITGLNESQVKVYIFRARVFLKNYIGHPEKVL